MFLPASSSTIGGVPAAADASELRFRRVAAAAALVLALTTAWLHEPWIDERGPWGAALASGSLADVFVNIRQNGHPYLWYAIVFLVQRTIGQFFALQVLNALVAAATAYVVARWAPFPRAVRALVLLGYFPLFEYGTIVRAYGIAFLAACAACALLAARPRRPVLFAAALVVLAQTSVYGVLMTIAFVAAWTIDALRARRRGEALPAPASTALAGLLVAATVALSVVQMIPPADTGYAVPWHLHPDRWRTIVSLRVVSHALLPLPMPQFHFWNTTLVDRVDGNGAVVGALLFVAVVLLLRRRAAALALWSCATVAILVFTYVKFNGAMRHHGHVFVTFLAAAWLAASVDAEGGAAPGRRQRAAFVAVLAVQALAGVACAAADAVLPFSACGRAAEFLRERGLDRLPMVGDRDSQAAGVAAAVERPMHFPSNGRTTTFVAWDALRRKYVPYSGTLAAADHVREREGGEVVLVMNRALDVCPPGVELLATFEPSVVANECYFIYLDRRTAR